MATVGPNTVQPLPVAPTGDGEHNTITLQFSTLKIWLLDHYGKRMGADPSAEDPNIKSCGAPYRLVLASAEERRGYADKDGLLVEHAVTSLGTCTLYWGRRDGEYGLSPFELGRAWGDYLVYEEQIDLEAGANDDAEAQRKLSNLGYEGEPDDMKAAFAQHYGASDNASIEAAHTSGTPRR